MIEGKKYRFTDEQIKPLAPNRGECMASDMITVDGYKVGFMYRQKPDFEGDSGWRFLTGFETDQYMDQAENFGLFDLNWIVNCDPEILPCLDFPVDSAFGRDPASGNRFVEIEDFDAGDEESA